MHQGDPGNPWAWKICVVGDYTTRNECLLLGLNVLYWQTDIDLGDRCLYHSAFSCPVMRRELDTPMRLKCGHVISQEAQAALRQGSRWVQIVVVPDTWLYLFGWEVCFGRFCRAGMYVVCTLYAVRFLTFLVCVELESPLLPMYCECTYFELFEECFFLK